jgi:hypothetical protein
MTLPLWQQAIPWRVFPHRVGMFDFLRNINQHLHCCQVVAGHSSLEIVGTRILVQ